MQPTESSEALTRPIDSETDLPSAVEELIRQRDEVQRDRAQRDRAQRS